MRKFIFFLLLCLVPFCLISGQPDSSEQINNQGIDTVKTFVTSSARLTLPAFDAAGNYDFDFGFNIGFDRKVGDNVTIGVAYSKWQAKGENSADIKGDYTAGIFSYWLYKIGSGSNACINFSPGYSKMIDGSQIKEQLGMAMGMGLLINLFRDIHFRFDWGTAKYGEQIDAFYISMGLSFKWN